MPGGIFMADISENAFLKADLILLPFPADGKFLVFKIQLAEQLIRNLRY